MAKLSKAQAQAIINKLGREYNNKRTQLIEYDIANYIKSPNAVKLESLIKERDILENKKNLLNQEINTLVSSLGIKNYYIYDTIEEGLKKLITTEIESRYKKLDLDAALDDLIIEAIEDNFNVDNFIKQYLKQMRNE